MPACSKANAIDARPLVVNILFCTSNIDGMLDGLNEKFDNDSNNAEDGILGLGNFRVLMN